MINILYFMKGLVQMKIMKENKTKYVIRQELKGIRLDKSITLLDEEISRMAVQRLLEEEKITVNRKSTKGIL